MDGRRLAIFAAALFGLIAAEPVRAQGTRTLSNDLISARSDLTADQQKQLADFVTFHTDALKGSDAEAVKNARRELLRPLGPGATDLFRYQYSKALIPVVQAIISGPQDPKHPTAFGEYNAV